MKTLTPISEKEFLQMVRDLATLYGWRAFHVHDSRRSPVGFPDLLLLRGARQVVCELKVAGRHPTPAQDAWLEAFEAAGVEAFVWTPDSWETIERTLRP